MRQLNGSFEKSLAILMRQKSEWDDTGGRRVRRPCLQRSLPTIETCRSDDLGQAHLRSGWLCQLGNGGRARPGFVAAWLFRISARLHIGRSKSIDFRATNAKRLRTLGSQPLPSADFPKTSPRTGVFTRLSRPLSLVAFALHTTDLALWVPVNAARTPLRNNAIARQQVPLRFTAHSAVTVEAV